jgi:hypothetical protein
MSAGSSPAAPNYVGAAKEQGKQNLLAAVQTGFLNNPNISNPYGEQSVSWEQVGGTAATKATKGHYVGTGKNKKWVPGTKATKGSAGTWQPSVKQTLAPAQQGILDSQNAGKLAASQKAAQIAQGLNLPAISEMNLPAIGGGEKYRQDVIDAMMSRYNKDYDLQKEQSNSELLAAGIRPGTDAYETVVRRNQQGRNDAMMQAILNGGAEASRSQGMDIGARQQLIGERSVPINEMAALMSGSAVQSPFAGGLGFQGGAGVNAAPTLQGAQAQGQQQQNQYNQQQAYTNSNINAGAGLLGTLGSAAIKNY